MTSEEAKSFLIDISYKLGNMAVEYLTEKDGEKMREATEALEQEPCEDAISRHAVLNIIEKEPFKGDAIAEIEKLPSVQPMRKRGKWKGTDEWYHRCSNCKEVFHFYIGEYIENNNWNICPNCGSYNREDGE